MGRRATRAVDFSFGAAQARTTSRVIGLACTLVLLRTEFAEPWLSHCLADVIDGSVAPNDSDF
jgi:hypothetical protein